MATMTLNLPEAEMKVLDQIAEQDGVTKTAVMCRALRLYQLVNTRAEAGERLYFEGDDQRRFEVLLP